MLFRSRRRLDLRRADPRLGVRDLALQVGAVDRVMVDHRDRADARAGEVEQRRRAQAASADIANFATGGASIMISQVG